MGLTQAPQQDLRPLFGADCPLQSTLQVGRQSIPLSLCVAVEVTGQSLDPCDDWLRHNRRLAVKRDDLAQAGEIPRRRQVGGCQVAIGKQIAGNNSSPRPVAGREPPPDANEEPAE